jgi:hypothetical protein
VCLTATLAVFFAAINLSKCCPTPGSGCSTLRNLATSAGAGCRWPRWACGSACGWCGASTPVLFYRLAYLGTVPDRRQAALGRYALMA